MSHTVRLSPDDLNGDLYELCSKDLLRRMEEERDQEAEWVVRWVINRRPIPVPASPPHKVIESPACPPGSAILMDVAQVNRHFAFVDGVLCKLEPHARPIRQPVDLTNTADQE
jgi:hypothetical protein